MRTALLRRASCTQASLYERCASSWQHVQDLGGLVRCPESCVQAPRRQIGSFREGMQERVSRAIAEIFSEDALGNFECVGEAPPAARPTGLTGVIRAPHKLHPVFAEMAQISCRSLGHHRSRWESPALLAIASPRPCGPVWIPWRRAGPSRRHRTILSCPTRPHLASLAALLRRPSTLSCFEPWRRGRTIQCDEPTLSKPCRALHCPWHWRSGRRSRPSGLRRPPNSSGRQTPCQPPKPDKTR